MLPPCSTNKAPDISRLRNRRGARVFAPLTDVISTLHCRYRHCTSFYSASVLRCENVLYLLSKNVYLHTFKQEEYKPMQRMRLAFLYTFSIQEKQRGSYTNLRTIGYKGYLPGRKRKRIYLCLQIVTLILMGKCVQTLECRVPSSLQHSRLRVCPGQAPLLESP
jgi:hypothetical protein